MAVVVAHPVEFDLLEVSGAAVLVWLTAAQPIQHISNAVLSFYNGISSDMAGLSVKSFGYISLLRTQSKAPSILFACSFLLGPLCRRRIKSNLQNSPVGSAAWLKYRSLPSKLLRRDPTNQPYARFPQGGYLGESRPVRG